MRRTVDRKIRTVANVEEAGVGRRDRHHPGGRPARRQNRGRRRGPRRRRRGASGTLRTNLRFVDVDKPPRSIVVTSANADEGKSTVSSNLARMMAAAGQPTVLIDADLRRPSLAATFDLDPSVGLTQVLAGDVALQDVLQETRTPNLHVITAGRIPPNPSELLGSQRMHRLVEQLTQEFIVILDAPPLLPVTDAGLLSVHRRRCAAGDRRGQDARWSRSSSAARSSSQVGGRLSAAVLNLAPSRGPRRRGLRLRLRAATSRATARARAGSAAAGARRRTSTCRSRRRRNRSPRGPSAPPRSAKRSGRSKAAS